MNSEHFNARNHQRMLKIYRALPAAEQRILQALAVIILPVNQTELQAFLREYCRQVASPPRKSRTRAAAKVTQQAQPIEQAALAETRSELWKGLADVVAKPWRERLLDQDILRRSNNRLTVHPLLLQSLSRAAQQAGHYTSLATAVQQQWPTPTVRSYYGESVSEYQRRDLQHAFYCQQFEQLFKLLGIKQHFSVVDSHASEQLLAICGAPWDEEYFLALPAPIQFQLLAPKVYLAPYTLEAAEYPFDLLRRMTERDDVEPGHGLRMLMAQQHLYRGQIDQGAALVSSMSDDYNRRGLQCWLHFLNGDYAAVISDYREALKQMRKAHGKRTIYLPGMPCLCYVMALLHSRDLALARKHLQLVMRSNQSDMLQAAIIELLPVVDILQGTLQVEDSELIVGKSWCEAPAYVELVRLSALLWLEDKPSVELKALTKYTRAAQKAGWHWYAREGALLLRALGKPSADKALQQTLERLTFASISTVIKPVPAWQRSLSALQDLVEMPAASGAVAPAASARLVWWLEEGRGEPSLVPREQKRLKNGRWSKGRAVSLKRLAEEAEAFDYLTDQDHRICQQIRRYETWSSHGAYELPVEPALRAAVGHPLIFRPEQLQQAVELVSGDPELRVLEQGAQLQLQLYPYPESLSDAFDHRRDCNLLQEAPQRLRLVQFTPQHLRIAEILGGAGLTVPCEAREQVLASINAIAPLLTVHSDIGGGEQGAREISADPRLHLQLQPQGEGLRLAWYVRPFALSQKGLVSDLNNPVSEVDGAAAEPEFGPMFRPGEGGATVFAEIAGEKLQASRTLKQEKAQLERFLEETALPAAASDSECVLDEAELALETLLRVQQSEQDLVLSWPRGQKIKVLREAGVQQMQVSVSKQRDWFALEGQIQIDQERVLEMTQLMSLLNAAPGRFVRLGDGEVIALTQDLRRRLQTLDAYSRDGRFHPLASEALEGTIEGMEVESSAAWRKQLKQLDSARSLQPQLPSTLQAELRDYQLEGYNWLARLAHLGAGACLADDMGLGKTLQALALILSRASEGPTLVLAPTSVCMNWLDEAHRFAPTLQASRFGDVDSRQAQIDQLGPYQVLVCSYGLLQREGERLAEVKWHTIVADEAQAIKNAATKRSRAVMALQGDFKLITTGTPIENHLGELWNLFRFINPGLLGSLEQFNKDYATPIEVQQDREARQRLKQLIRPFILRRMKSDVLTELPARTEVTLKVELDQQERVFYEAVRRQALERLADDDEDSAGKRRVKMLAEIMRLRRACCHPRLVMPESDIASAKLKAFGALLDELLESRHKALVFSQFVGHLDLLREHLDSKGIHYQYLDGSTPAAKRKKAVVAFQRGEGDVFLISLKAGGAGLNLTAADYVIHMDPWWNPAVEDQASDRAHRMGQQRPVTIYRLVAKDTIEEKIVSMHAHKRDLADSLLEGSEMSGKMSVDEMMALIEEV